MSKKAHLANTNDYHPVVLTSQVMKVLEQIVLYLLWLQVQYSQDPLQFAHKEKLGVDNAVLYLLHQALTSLDN